MGIFLCKGKFEGKDNIAKVGNVGKAAVSDTFPKINIYLLKI